MSTLGMSTPSLKRSTVKTARSFPSERSRNALLRSSERLVCRECHRRQTELREALGHEMRMADADAVAEGSHPRRIGDLPPDFFDYQMSPRVISCEDAFERCDVISLSAAPRDPAQVEPVMNTEVRKRREVLLIDGIPKSQLGGDSTVEVAEHVEPIRTLRCRSQPKQLDWLDAVEERLVRRRRGMMELVHDHDVEVRRIDVPDIGAVEALDRREDVLEPLGPVAPTHFSPNAASRSACRNVARLWSMISSR